MIFDVIFTVFKLLHPWNALFKILVIPDGIVIDGNDSHPLNAWALISVTDDGIVIDVRLEQP